MTEGIYLVKERIVYRHRAHSCSLPSLPHLLIFHLCLDCSPVRVPWSLVQIWPWCFVLIHSEHYWISRIWNFDGNHIFDLDLLCDDSSSQKLVTDDGLMTMTLSPNFNRTDSTALLASILDPRPISSTLVSPGALRAKRTLDERNRRLLHPFILDDLVQFLSETVKVVDPDRFTTRQFSALMFCLF